MACLGRRGVRGADPVGTRALRRRCEEPPPGRFRRRRRPPRGTLRATSLRGGDGISSRNHARIRRSRSPLRPPDGDRGHLAARGVDRRSIRPPRSAPRTRSWLATIGTRHRPASRAASASSARLQTRPPSRTARPSPPAPEAEDLGPVGAAHARTARPPADAHVDDRGRGGVHEAEFVTRSQEPSLELIEHLQRAHRRREVLGRPTEGSVGRPAPAVALRRRGAGPRVPLGDPGPCAVRPQLTEDQTPPGPLDLLGLEEAHPAGREDHLALVHDPRESANDLAGSDAALRAVRVPQDEGTAVADPGLQEAARERADGTFERRWATACAASGAGAGSQARARGRSATSMALELSAGSAAALRRPQEVHGRAIGPAEELCPQPRELDGPPSPIQAPEAPVIRVREHEDQREPSLRAGSQDALEPRLRRRPDPT